MQKVFRGLAVCVLAAGLTSAQTAPVTKIRVDASNAPQRLFHASLTMPVQPGPLTLLHPKWIPGDHQPTGPISDLVGLKISGAGKPIPWTRDTVDMSAFHVDVPAGVTALNIELDLIAAPEALAPDSSVSATPQIMIFNWGGLLLYPKGAHTDQMNYQATLKVPAGWRFGTALPIATESAGTIEFRPGALTTLVDSPLIAGRYFQTLDLNPGGAVPHYIHLAGDSAKAVETSPQYAANVRNLVKEETALFGPGHYRSYHFLLSLSDHMQPFAGLEHHESSDNRLTERALLSESSRRYTGDLLAHEMAHSWNGKFRRPAGLATKDYSEPMKGDLLWVYEGMTQYWGLVLAARSGAWTPEDFRDNLAMLSARLSNEAGRAWRTLEDTAVAVQISYAARNDYANLRRGADYYEESALIWLEADTIIRQKSGGKKSLDDFCKVFHTGGPAGMPDVKPYGFEDIVTALNGVQAYDWAGFLTGRIRKVAPFAPMGGVEAAGWKLVYGETRSEFQKSMEEYEKVSNFSYSPGLIVKEDATISDVQVTSKAYAAGIAPATKLIAVNGRQYTPEILRDALDAAKGGTEPLELLVKDGEFYKTHRVDYHEGQRYPHLERMAATPDLMSEIIRAKAR
jgi:predicted metalloprotease with PDZ domain